jgi:hypothetical protein
MQQIAAGVRSTFDLTGIFCVRRRNFFMTKFMKLLTAAAVIGGVTAPAAAQYQYPAPVPQPAPGQPGYGYYPQQQGYGQQGYGYGQQDSIGAIIGQLLGNRYNVTDRTRVQQCASAAVAQASAQYRPRNGYGQPPYGNAYGYHENRYNQAYPASMMRVTAITNVERRNNGLRVSGLLDSRSGYPPRGQAYGYQNNGHAATGDLTFRCNVDYRGAVSNVRLRRAVQYRG